MVLSKFGFTPREIWAMCVVEVSAWVRSYCESLGIKPKAEENTVYSARIPLSELKRGREKKT